MISVTLKILIALVANAASNMSQDRVASKVAGKSGSHEHADMSSKMQTTLSHRESVPIKSTLLVLESQEEWMSMLEDLVLKHGRSVVENWRDEVDKHKHHLIHLAVMKNFTQVLTAMVTQMGFDPNVPRSSDQCTPLHLAIWWNKPEMARLLVSLGADQTLENAYGESCLASLAQVHGNVDLSDTVLAAWSTAAQRRIGTFNAEMLANTARAFAKKGQSDAQLFIALARATEWRISTFNAEGLAKTSSAFS